MEQLNDFIFDALQDILVEQYYEILYVDLNKDSYAIIALGDHERFSIQKTTQTEKLSQWFDWFADSQLCYEGDRARFRDFVDQENLRRVLSANRYQSVSLRFRRKFSLSDREFSWVELTVTPENVIAGEMKAFVFAKNITEEIELYQRQERALDAVNQYLDQKEGRRTILIVEDNLLNREILEEILSDEYDVIQAENGQVGFDLLNKYYDRISAVLLDVNMPVMDGYEFLRITRQDMILKQIPVIVATGNQGEEEEERCLELGASDFVTKPYNSGIVKKRLRNFISLRETATQLSAVEFDDLTELYTKQAFILHAESIIRRNPDVRFDLMISDVEDFKHINEKYGREKADEFLRYWGRCFKSENIEDWISARYGADQFVFLMRNDGSRDLEELAKSIFMQNKENNPIRECIVKMGLYNDVDHNLTIPAICDRAVLALQSVKHKYAELCALYTPEMQARLNRERIIESCMVRSLKNEEFHVYYQPKHDAAAGRITGAEALVRWNHPEYGFMSPGEFISVFERNGFISTLDFYIWDKVCRDLKDWKDRHVPLVPISINASRRDFEKDNFRDYIYDPLEKTGIPKDLLHMEVTESLCMNEGDKVLKETDMLRSEGLVIELDDFGSGYSSLGMLNQMSFDIIKLDMSFVRNLEKQGKVVQAMINLAHELGYKTIAEGVETQDQLNTLKSMNCDYIQGYYFSKPLPHDEFE